MAVIGWIKNDKKDLKQKEQEQSAADEEIEMMLLEKMMREIELMDSINDNNVYKEFLAEGAYMGCEYGYQMATLRKNKLDFAYIGSDEVLLDNTQIHGTFGVCHSPYLSDNDKGGRYTITIPAYRNRLGNKIKVDSGTPCNMQISQTWKSVEDEIVVYDSKTQSERKILTTKSYLTCYRGRGCIFPVNSGQKVELQVDVEGSGEEENYPYVDIPQDNRNLGTIISYMGWHQITGVSDQLTLKNNANSDGRYSIGAKPKYYAMIDDRMLIATKKNIGGMLEVSIGDYLDVLFEASDGTKKTYKCIAGDVKEAGAESSSWGHYNGQGVVEIIYNSYNPPAGYDSVNVPESAGNNPWGKGKVLRITIVGNYYDS